jgi:hypothetical protein
MGIFDSIGKIIKQPYEMGKGIFNTITGQPSDAEKKLMKEQMRAYKEQTEITKNEINRAKDEQLVEKRRIQEKQIRALRGKSSSRGFLGTTSPEASTPGTSSKLGG